MAFGDGPDDAPLDAAWEAFCDRLRAAGRQAFKDRNPPAGIQRADAFRFLTQTMGQAFDLALETRDPAWPLLHRFCTPTRKLGSDCADFTYTQAWIDGAHAYRLSGTVGTARFLNVTVQGPRPERLANGNAPLHDPFGDVPEANLFGHEMAQGPDGAFELFIGGERDGRANWLPTTPGTRKLFLRQGFDAWDEEPARMTIERLGMDAPRPVPDAAEMVRAMEWAGDLVTGAMRDWPDWPFANGGASEADVNAFPGLPGDADDARRGRAATNMHWALARDEALIVEFPAHAGLWMLTNMGAFMTSMDFLYRPVSYTPARTHVDGDGMVRLYLAHDDPGLPNWIDTQGFARGHLTYRHMLEGAPAPLSTRLVARADLAATLPADTPRVTAAARTAELHRRFAAIRMRHGL